MLSLRRVLSVVSLASAATLATGVLASSPATATPDTASPAARTAAPRSAATWAGWRGVTFGTTLTVAHQRLGGRLSRTDPGGGCGDVLTTRTGSYDGNGYARSHRVGTVIVDAGISYPLGVDATMRPRQIERAARHGAYRLTTQVFDPYDTGDLTHYDKVTGPHGHVLWFAFTDGDKRPYRMGLSINKHVAQEQLTANGC